MRKHSTLLCTLSYPTNKHLDIIMYYYLPYTTKKISLFVLVSIVIPTNLHAAQPAAASSGWQAQSMQPKIADFERKFAPLHKARQEKQKRIEQVNKRLGQMSKPEEYERRKSTIKAAVELGHIHPNDIIAGSPFSCLICEATYRSDLPFVQFLLQNNADPNRTSDGYGVSQAPALVYAHSNVLIAHALVTAGTSLKEYGIRALHSAVMDADENGADLVKWYLDRGVPVNDYFQGYTPLFSCVSFVLCPDKVLFLLQEGALLSAVGKGKKEAIYYGYNIPQIIRSQNENSSLKGLLKQHSEYRHNGIKQDLALCKGSGDKPLLAPLCALVIQYYVQSEPTYEELEQIPLQENPWHRWQRDMWQRDMWS